MTLLLVQLPTSHKGAGERVYPLGLARLAAVIPEGIAYQALDMNMEVDPWATLKEKIKAMQPRTIALSFRNIDPLAGIHSSYIASLQTAALLCRVLAPDAVIIAGGPAFSLFAEQLMVKIDTIDFGLIGEGEMVFPQLLASMAMPHSIPGLIWRNNKKIIRNPPARCMDLDTLPSLVDSPFNPADYQKGNAYIAAMGIEGKRGCDLACGYCIYPRLGGGRMRLRSPKKIADEMEMLYQRHNITLFHFTDSVVNRPEEHFKAVCRELITRKLPIGWTGFFRENSFSEESAVLAKKAGLIACYFSADALTDHGLQLLNKRMTKTDILTAARLTVKHDILTMCHFLVNLPFEMEEHQHESRAMLEQLLDIHALSGNLGAVIFNTIRLYPDAPLTRLLLAKKMLHPKTNLLYPMYYNPPQSAHILHELDALCHRAGVMTQLGLSAS